VDASFSPPKLQKEGEEKNQNNKQK